MPPGDALEDSGETDSVETDSGEDVTVLFSTTGDITLPNHTRQGDTYNISSINLDTAGYQKFGAALDFSCNVCITDANLHLRFQIFKQGMGGVVPVPVGPGYHFSRTVHGTESDTISFSAYDGDSSKSVQLNYSVYVRVMGDEIDGTASITNPVLIATISES